MNLFSSLEHQVKLLVYVERPCCAITIILGMVRLLTRCEARGSSPPAQSTSRCILTPGHLFLLFCPQHLPLLLLSPDFFPTGYLHDLKPIYDMTLLTYVVVHSSLRTVCMRSSRTEWSCRSSLWQIMHCVPNISLFC